MKDDKVTKAEFVWAMVKLAELDRAKYRELREKGWRAVEQAEISPRKSEYPN